MQSLNFNRGCEWWFVGKLVRIRNDFIIAQKTTGLHNFSANF